MSLVIKESGSFLKNEKQLVFRIGHQLPTHSLRLGASHIHARSPARGGSASGSVFYAKSARIFFSPNRGKLVCFACFFSFHLTRPTHVRRLWPITCPRQPFKFVIWRKFLIKVELRVLFLWQTSLFRPCARVTLYDWTQMCQ